MTRVRISTTVDAERLTRARNLLDLPDSELIDRALDLLAHSVLADKEIETLTKMPYESDPALNWEPPAGPSLPYDGEVPEAVRKLARRRRQS